MVLVGGQLHARDQQQLGAQQEPCSAEAIGEVGPRLGEGLLDLAMDQEAGRSVGVMLGSQPWAAIMTRRQCSRPQAPCSGAVAAVPIRALVLPTAFCCRPCTGPM